ncbi:hypothetical protein A9Q94_18015 [Rhodobacterales bacterium 56_14_T64]|nr:hypothetical protein A9Q94_18015 [Rhodobacterales bacterium 56_14_T64]
MTVSEIQAIFRAGFPIFLFLSGLLLVFWYSSLSAMDAELAHKDTNRLITKLALIAVLCVSVRSRSDLGIIIYTLIVSTAISAGFTMIEYFRGSPVFDIQLHEETLATWDGVFRSSGASKEVPPMAASMMLAGVAIAAILLVRSRQNRMFLAAVVLMGVAAIAMTVTRSAMMSCGVILVCMLFYYRNDPVFPWLVRVTSVAVVLVALALPANIVSKFTAVSSTTEDTTVARRLAYQIIGFDLIRQHPLFGVGAGNYIVHYAQDSYRYTSGRGEEARPLHNNYLQYAAETGIVGFSAFMGLIFTTGLALLSAVRRASGSVRDYSEAILFAYFAMLLQLLFLSSKFLVSFWVLIGLAIVVRRIALRDFAPECSEADQDLPEIDGFDVTSDALVIYNSESSSTRKDLAIKTWGEHAFVFLNGLPLAKIRMGADRSFGLNVRDIFIVTKRTVSKDAAK